jgi:hypothetical protein
MRNQSPAWWYTPIITVTWEMDLEGLQSEASAGKGGRYYLKNKLKGGQPRIITASSTNKP